jgi:hypothetical protein
MRAYAKIHQSEIIVGASGEEAHATDRCEAV